MLLNDRPSLFWVIIFLLAGIFSAFGYPFGYRVWSLPVTAVLLGVGFFELWNWVKWQNATHRIWENTAESARYSVELQTAQEINRMSNEKFVGWLYMKALDAADPEAREAFVERYGELANRLYEAADYATAGQDGGTYRRYALEAIDYARKSGGKLPAVRVDGPEKDGWKRRTAYEEFYKRLDAAKIFKPSSGPNSPRVLDIERAEQIARAMGA